MPKSSPAPTHISVAAHPDLPDALAECQAIADFLADRGVQTISGSLYDETLRQQIQKGCCDALIALGGDGTMLRAVHLCAPLDIPILGINLGHFGFLMEVKANQWRETLPRLMSGEIAV